MQDAFTQATAWPHVHQVTGISIFWEIKASILYFKVQRWCLKVENHGTLRAETHKGVRSSSVPPLQSMQGYQKPSYMLEIWHKGDALSLISLKNLDVIIRGTNLQITKPQLYCANSLIQAFTRNHLLAHLSKFLNKLLLLKFKCL